MVTYVGNGDDDPLGGSAAAGRLLSLISWAETPWQSSSSFQFQLRAAPRCSAPPALLASFLLSPKSQVDVTTASTASTQSLNILPV